MRAALLGLFLVGLSAGCASTPAPATREQAAALARAFARLVRLTHDLHGADEGLNPPPRSAELATARARLESALAELSGVAAVGSRSLGETLRAARQALVPHDYLVLPARTAHPADLPLVRVTGRRVGQTQRLWGHTLRYRLVEHEGTLVGDYASHRALRSGRGPLAPAGRAADPTIYLDRAAVRRRAGKGPYADLDAEGLAARVILEQAAWIQFGRRLEAQEPGARERLHALVLLTILQEGHWPGARTWLERVATDPLPTPRRAAAQRVLQGLRDGAAPEALRRRWLSDG